MQNFFFSYSIKERNDLNFRNIARGEIPARDAEAALLELGKRFGVKPGPATEDAEILRSRFPVLSDFEGLILVSLD